MGSASVSDPLLLQYFKTQVRKSHMKVILKFADAILRTKFSIAITDFFCLPAICRAEHIAVRFRAPSARSPNQSNSFCAPAAIYPGSARSRTLPTRARRSAQRCTVTYLVRKGNATLRCPPRPATAAPRAGADSQQGVDPRITRRQTTAVISMYLVLRR